MGDLYAAPGGVLGYYNSTVAQPTIVAEASEYTGLTYSPNLEETLIFLEVAVPGSWSGVELELLVAANASAGGGCPSAELGVFEPASLLEAQLLLEQGLWPSNRSAQSSLYLNLTAYEAWVFAQGLQEGQQDPSLFFEGCPLLRSQRFLFVIPFSACPLDFEVASEGTNGTNGTEALYFAQVEGVVEVTGEESVEFGGTTFHVPVAGPVWFSFPFILSQDALGSIPGLVISSGNTTSFASAQRVLSILILPYVNNPFLFDVQISYVTSTPGGFALLADRVANVTGDADAATVSATTYWSSPECGLQYYSQEDVFCLQQHRVFFKLNGCQDVSALVEVGHSVLNIEPAEELLVSVGLGEQNLCRQPIDAVEIQSEIAVVTLESGLAWLDAFDENLLASLNASGELAGGASVPYPAEYSPSLIPAISVFANGSSSFVYRVEEAGNETSWLNTTICFLLRVAAANQAGEVLPDFALGVSVEHVANFVSAFGSFAGGAEIISSDTYLPEELLFLPSFEETVLWPEGGTQGCCPENHLFFCYEQAFNFTQSLSIVHNIQLKISYSDVDLYMELTSGGRRRQVASAETTSRSRAARRETYVGLVAPMGINWGGEDERHVLGSGPRHASFALVEAHNSAAGHKESYPSADNRRAIFQLQYLFPALAYLLLCSLIAALAFVAVRRARGRQGGAKKGQAPAGGERSSGGAPSSEVEEGDELLFLGKKDGNLASVFLEQYDDNGDEGGSAELHTASTHPENQQPWADPWQWLYETSGILPQVNNYFDLS